MEFSKKIYDVTLRIFSNWTALKLIVEHDMATKDQVETFVQYISDTLCMNDQLIERELSDEIDDYVSITFNTEIENEDYYQIATELIRFFNYMKNNEEITFNSEIEKLSPLQNWLAPSPPRVPTYVDPKDSSDEEEMQVDGWVTVTSKRKGHK